METRSNHILVGSVVLALVVAVLAFIIWLSPASGPATQEYDVFFKTAVDGLARGRFFTAREIAAIAAVAVHVNEAGEEVATAGDA